jgi:hypothetical protein
MFQLRHTFLVRAWSAGHCHLSLSFQPVAALLAQEQMDSPRLSGWSVLFLPASRTPETAMVMAFALGFSLQNTNRTKGKV